MNLEIYWLDLVTNNAHDSCVMQDKAMDGMIAMY
jgi:hypothetical protein